MLGSSPPWDSVVYWALDLETGGLDPRRDPVLAVGMLPIREGTLRLGDRHEVKLRGSLAAWPVDWPALPAPLSASTAPIAWTADYLGAPDFGVPLTLAFVREQTTLDTRLVASELQAWLDQADAGPLPPLHGRLRTPTLDVSGFTLEGVEISVEDDAPADAEGPPP